MFENIFSPFARIKRRLKKIDELARLDEVILKSGRKERDKIDVLKNYNKSIKRNLERAKDIFFGKIPDYEKEEANKKVIGLINADIKKLFDKFTALEKLIEKDEEELKLMAEEDSAFVNEVTNDLISKYSDIVTEIDILEKHLKDLKEPESEKDIEAAKNEAQIALDAGRVVTKSRELKKIARACGYVLAEGANHTDVLSNGVKISEIPNHTNISVGTARNILKALARGEFTGTKVA